MSEVYRLKQIQDINNVVLLLNIAWINQAYSGYSVTLRRASDNAENDFGFADGEIDWAAIDTWRAGSNVYIKTWYDQSFYINNATQTTNAKQPLLDTVNKKIVFSASSDNYLEVANSTTTNLNSHDWTLTVDANLSGYNNQGSTINSILCKDSATFTDTSYGLILDNTNKVYLKTGVSKGTSTASVSIGYRKTLLGTKTGTNAYLYEDNDELASGSSQTGASDNANSMYIGGDSSANRYIDMDLYGVSLYKSSALESGDRKLYNSPVPELYLGLSGRRIYGNSTIDLLTLRENSGDTTQKFQLDANAGYADTKEIATFLNGADGFFTEWYDQKNNSRKFIQNTLLSWQPQYVENAINNKLGFESEIPATVVKKMVSSSAINLETAATFFCVVDVTNANQGVSGSALFANNDLLTINTFSVTFSTTNLYLRIKDNNNSFDNSLFAAFTSGKKIYSIVCDGINNIKLYDRYNHNLINKTVANGFLNKILYPSVGAFTGKFSEFKIFRSVLSQDLREEVERDMAGYYNIPGY